MPVNQQERLFIAEDLWQVLNSSNKSQFKGTKAECEEYLKPVRCIQQQNGTWALENSKQHTIAEYSTRSLAQAVSKCVCQQIRI